MSVQIASVIIVRDNRVLLVQQRKQSAYGRWNYPGGKVETGETLEAAVIREVREELGVELHSAAFFKTYATTTAEGHAEINSFTGQISDDITLKSDELLAYGWFSLESLVTMRDRLRSPIVEQQAREVLERHTS